MFRLKVNQGHVASVYTLYILIVRVHFISNSFPGFRRRRHGGLDAICSGNFGYMEGSHPESLPFVKGPGPYLIQC